MPNEKLIEALVVFLNRFANEDAELIEQAIAALEKPTEPHWRPIETLPLDGLECLFYNELYKATCLIPPMAEEAKEPYRKQIRYWATHWFPMPTMPPEKVTGYDLRNR